LHDRIIIEAVLMLGALFGPDWTLNSSVARALVTIGDEMAQRTLLEESPASRGKCRTVLYR
jgi:hypothetical protein